MGNWLALLSWSTGQASHLHPTETLHTVKADCLVLGILQLAQQSGTVEQLPGDATGPPGTASSGGCSCGLESHWPGEPSKLHAPLNMYGCSCTSLVSHRALRLLLQEAHQAAGLRSQATGGRMQLQQLVLLRS